MKSHESTIFPFCFSHGQLGGFRGEEVPRWWNRNYDEKQINIWSQIILSS